MPSCQPVVSSPTDSDAEVAAAACAWHADVTGVHSTSEGCTIVVEVACKCQPEPMDVVTIPQTQNQNQAQAAFFRQLEPGHHKQIIDLASPTSDDDEDGNDEIAAPASPVILMFDRKRGLDSQSTEPAGSQSSPILMPSPQSLCPSPSPKTPRTPKTPAAMLRPRWSLLSPPCVKKSRTQRREEMKAFDAKYKIDPEDPRLRGMPSAHWEFMSPDSLSSSPSLEKSALPMADRVTE